jgi:acyl-CoA reductase-like NAD-dependent aldehyde dehydrogenase
MKSLNPANGAVVGEVALTPVESVPAIVARARTAQPAWAALGTRRRADLLAKTAEAFAAKVDEHAALITAEMGKPLKEAVAEARSLGSGLVRELDEIVEALEPEVREDGRARSTV